MKNKKKPLYCGTAEYVVILVLNVGLHIAFLVFNIIRQEWENLLPILFSFFCFLHLFTFIFDFFFSIRPSVVKILKGKTKVNNDYYMNYFDEFVYERNSVPSVTISIPVHVEDNRVLFATLETALASVKKFRSQTGKEANIVVSDDGLAIFLNGECSKDSIDFLYKKEKIALESMTDEEKWALERISYYRKNRIGFVARCQAGRRGLFKKASNLNNTIRLSRLFDNKDFSNNELTQERTISSYFEGDITFHEIILFVDKDTDINEDVIWQVVPEFLKDEKLSYIQCSGHAINIGDNYYSNVTGKETNNLFHNVWPCQTLKGFFVPLVGHNVFIRKETLINLGLWNEKNVSEDYDFALTVYRNGFHGKYCYIKDIEFGEYAADSFEEESAKRSRYSFGYFDMVFGKSFNNARPNDHLFLNVSFMVALSNMLALPVMFLFLYLGQMLGNLDSMVIGFAITMGIFALLPTLRKIFLAPFRRSGDLFNIFESIALSLSYIGHSFSNFIGGARYFANKIRKEKKGFSATSVDQSKYSFKTGCKVLGNFISSNLLTFTLVTALSIERTYWIWTSSGIIMAEKIFFTIVLALLVFMPLFCTPQFYKFLDKKR